MSPTEPTAILVRSCRVTDVDSNFLFRARWFRLCFRFLAGGASSFREC